MIGKCRIIANVIEVDKEKSALHVGVRIENEGRTSVLRDFQGEIFVAVLKAMKDSNTSAFYEAMSYFISEELDDD